jgi:uncharacterized protein (DUF58 family)
LAPAPTRRQSDDWKYLSPQDLRNLKNLLFAARVIVEGAYTGRHKSPYRGRSAEFVDYREYEPGDEIRGIDWKAYARTDRYFVKLFEKETDMNCYVLVDRSASMGYGGKAYNSVFPTQELSKLEYASYLAAALLFLIIKQGDRASLTLFDEKVATHVPTGGTFAHLYTLLNHLEKQRPGKETSVSNVLRESFGLFKRRGLLIVLSDFLDDPVATFNALNMYRHRNFEIVLFHILHKYEYELPPLQSTNFIDSESGDMITTSPDEIRDSYHEAVKDFVEQMQTMARSRNIEYTLVNTAMPYSAALQKYLLRRGAALT